MLKGVDVIRVDRLWIDTTGGGGDMPYARNGYSRTVTTIGRSKLQIFGLQKYSNQFLRKHEKLGLTAEGRLCCVIGACGCCGSEIMKLPRAHPLFKKV